MRAAVSEGSGGTPVVAFLPYRLTASAGFPARARLMSTVGAAQADADRSQVAAGDGVQDSGSGSLLGDAGPAAPGSGSGSDVTDDHGDGGDGDGDGDGDDNDNRPDATVFEEDADSDIDTDVPADGE